MTCNNEIQDTEMKLNLDCVLSVGYLMILYLLLS